MEKQHIEEVLQIIEEAMLKIKICIGRQSGKSNLQYKVNRAYLAIPELLKELIAYKDAEEQGLFRLPCSIGEPIFVIPSITNYKLNKLNRHEENNRVYTQIVHSITFIKDGYLLNTCDGMCCVRSGSYNETWFLLESQAEAALKKMQEDKQ